MNLKHPRRPIAIAIMMIAQVAFAQNASLIGPQGSTKQLDALRNATRMQIEEVTEDSATSIDTMTELGRTSSSDS